MEGVRSQGVLTAGLCTPGTGRGLWGGGGLGLVKGGVYRVGRICGSEGRGLWGRGSD